MTVASQILIGTFDFWTNETVRDRGREALHSGRPVEDIPQSSIEEILNQSFSFMFSVSSSSLARFPIRTLGPSNPDVYIATTGEPGVENFAAIWASSDTLKVDTNESWGLEGILDMLLPGQFLTWVLSLPGITSSEPKNVLAGELDDRVPHWFFGSSATSYEVTFDQSFNIVTSWKCFIDDSLASSRTLRVRDLDEIFSDS